MHRDVLGGANPDIKKLCVGKREFPWCAGVMVRGVTDEERV